MNNKKIGTDFEKEVCDILAKRGFWVHFLSPDRTGAQPFDVIAVKDFIAFAMDCKTSVNHIFPYSRLEDNQIFAFEKWLKANNTIPSVIVKYKNKIYSIPYTTLKEKGKVDLNDDLFLMRESND